MTILESRYKARLEQTWWSGFDVRWAAAAMLSEREIQGLNVSIR